MNLGQLWRIVEGESIDNKYHLKKFLGAGGYGGVFLADIKPGASHFGKYICRGKAFR